MDCIVDFYGDIVGSSVLLIFMRILLIVLIFCCIIRGAYGFLVIWLVYLFYMFVNSIVAFYSIKPCYSNFLGGPTTRRSSLRCATSSAASSCLKIFRWPAAKHATGVTTA